MVLRYLYTFCRLIQNHKQQINTQKEKHVLLLVRAKTTLTFLPSPKRHKHLNLGKQVFSYFFPFLIHTQGKHHKRKTFSHELFVSFSHYNPVLNKETRYYWYKTLIGLVY